MIYKSFYASWSHEGGAGEKSTFENGWLRIIIPKLSGTQCLFFAKKSANIILIFLKSTRGYIKMLTFFPIFLNVEYSYSLIFLPLIDDRVRSRAIFALAGWLPLFLDDNLVDAILKRVWWTGFLEGNRWPIKPIPQASSAPLTKMRAKCGFRRH